MRAILAGITGLLSAATLVAQQAQPGMRGQSGDPSAPCMQLPATARGHMTQGHMMPGMMQGSRTGAMPMAGAMMGEPHMMSADLANVMHLSMLFAPQRIIKQADALKLSDDQKQRIERLANDLGSTMGPRGQAEQQLKTLVTAERPDPASVRSAAHTALGELTSLWSEQVVAAATVRGLLTGAQREQVQQHEPCWTPARPESR